VAVATGQSRQVDNFCEDARNLFLISAFMPPWREWGITMAIARQRIHRANGLQMIRTMTTAALVILCVWTMLGFLAP
jgi:hypothetical protein